MQGAGWHLGPVEGDMPMIARIAGIALAAILLAGCSTTSGITSIAGGEAKVFEAPKYEVRGVTQYDQDWIDNAVEGGIGAFGWPRPAERPPGLDKRPAVHAAPVVKRPSFLKRLKARVSRAPPPIVPPATQWPATPPTSLEASPAPADDPVAAPTPRSPLDELLDPTEPLPNTFRIR